MKSGESNRESRAMTVSRHISRLFLLLFTAICFQLPLARAAGSVPTVKTDKPDYPPGDTAEITGNGFLPGEQVECQVLRLDAPFDPSLSATYHWRRPRPARADGPRWDAAGAALELTAVGQTSSLVA